LLIGWRWSRGWGSADSNDEAPLRTELFTACRSTTAGGAHQVRLRASRSHRGATIKGAIG
jgi:hypothetical protein